MPQRWLHESVSPERRVATQKVISKDKSVGYRKGRASRHPVDRRPCRRRRLAVLVRSCRCIPPKVARADVAGRRSPRSRVRRAPGGPSPSSKEIPLSTETWLLVYGMLSAYCLAGCLMEHFAVFSGWTAVGSEEFRAVQTTQGHGSGIVYVIPKLVLTALLIALLVVAPDGIPSWADWEGVGGVVVAW